MSSAKQQAIGYADYAEFARAIYETGVLSDPWLDGNERFELQGAVLAPRRAQALAQAAERVAYVHQELVQVLLREPTLFTDFYHLTPYQRAMWESAGGLWHGMARADLFILADNQVVCCELNSDTPSGQAEAVILNGLLSSAHDGALDPNEKFEQRFVQMLRASHAKRGGDAPLESAGIVYPTELTEDLGMMTLLTRWLEAAGISVISGSPYNLRRSARGGVEVLGVPVDLVVRHYKTDWWGERLPVWKDAAAYPDPDPLDAPLGALLSAEMNDEVTVVNPFGSVVTQNKLSLAFFWEEQQRFSARSRRWIRQYIPETRRMSGIPAKQLRDEKELWVLKSDYGCEGPRRFAGRLSATRLGRRPSIWLCRSTSSPSDFSTPRRTREA
ncbi:MAG: hypothetical protein WKF30_02715 [Pyrinomonadaceae bacterium]